MKTKKLIEVLERIETWPPELQDELADFALELDAGFRSAEYEPTPEDSPASFAVCAMPRKAASRRRSRSKPLLQNS
jgi:hypothetical protein